MISIRNIHTPSGIARVVARHGDTLLLYLRRIMPGYTYGTQLDAAKLTHDLNCVDGMRWDTEERDFVFAGSEDIALPWRIVGASFRAPLPGEVGRIIEELRSLAESRAEAFRAQGLDDEAARWVEAGLSTELETLDVMETGLARDLWFAPPYFPGDVLDRPASEYALRIASLRLDPSPPSDLIEWRGAWWWPTWV